MDSHTCADKATEKTPCKKADLTGYTLQQYSVDKKLPEEYLKDFWGLTTETDCRDGMELSFVKMPYKDEAKDEVTYRIRFGNKEFRWKNGSSGKIIPYGVFMLPDIRKIGYVILVEGESDTQTLHYMGFPVLGIAGTHMFKAEQTDKLKDVAILYIHKQPGQEGETFFKKTCSKLLEGGYPGQVKVWSCKDLGAEDPSELYLKCGKEEAARKIKEAINKAEAVDLKAFARPKQQQQALVDPPVELKQAAGWIFSERGIATVIEEEDGVYVNYFCRTPILLTKRIKNQMTNEEKIEVAFKRDGQWISAIYPRTTAFSNRGILELSALGCTVTTENAKQVVKFLGALEAANIEQIPKITATSTFGWQPGRQFVPGHADGLYLDIDPSQQHLADGFCQNGTLEAWVAQMVPHRERHKFRFILAAGFAAPLLRILKQRIFIVYNWGGSKGGKTAALKAALSAWGDPDQLMVNFNATQVGLERTASFFNDLPLGIDERQLAGSKPGDLAQKVYMIASGKGRTRGSRSGGLQHTYQWRTVALATGEEPISSETTMTGVSTRMVEVYGAPFDNEADASRMHQQTAINYGWAGMEFIRRLIPLEDKDLCTAYEKMQAFITTSISGGKSTAHSASVCVVALADALIDSWFFSPPSSIDPARDYLEPLGIGPESWAKAKRMALELLQEQIDNNSSDVNENAVQFLTDWVLANQNFFGEFATGTCYGFSEFDKGAVYIYPTKLTEVLTQAGYSPRKTMKYLAEQGLISEAKEKSGKKTYSIVRRFKNHPNRFVEFFIGKLIQDESKTTITLVNQMAVATTLQNTNINRTRREDAPDSAGGLADGPDF